MARPLTSSQGRLLARLPRRPRSIPVLLAVAALAVAALALAGCGARAAPPSPTLPAGLAGCAAGTGAMLTTADLGAFTMYGDATETNLGLFGIGPHPIDAAFQAGRSRTWVATMALSGRYRADSDAYSIRLGYPIRDLPVIPLVGSIVTEHPAEPLEVFERILVFTDPSWASSWLDMTRQTVATQGASTANGVPQLPMTIANVDLGDEAIALVEPPAVGGDIATETSIMVQARAGRSVVGLTIRGGGGLTVDRVATLAREALSQFDSVCGSLE